MVTEKQLYSLLIQYKKAVSTKNIEEIGELSKLLEKYLLAESRIQRRSSPQKANLYAQLEVVHKSAEILVKGMRDEAKSALEQNSALKQQSQAYLETQIRSGG
ncbi:hypothetical protein F7U66_00820 [Vibrio parahaemolyticus]|nr:hypothetical protein [Vibrio parahaemolyticus]